MENEQDKKFIAKKVINKEKAHELMTKFDTTEKVDVAFRELNNYWDNLLNIFTVKNPEGKEKGVKQIIVDGKPIEGCVIPCQAGKHEVIVEM